MERKNRNIMVVLIALVIAVAVFSSFAVDFFSGTPVITLPPVYATPQPTPTGQTSASGVVRVEVTPETVQNVIATLSRPSSYYREITVTYAGGSSIVSSQWVDGGWTKTDTSLPGGRVRHSLVGGGTLYWWYDSSREWLTAPADGHTADVDGARIPTYEDILEAEPSEILEADYETKDGLDCIYVSVSNWDSTSSARYWVSVESGLLTAAELTEDGQTVLSMTSTAAERPVTEGTVFALPDGTVLHKSGGGQGLT